MSKIFQAIINCDATASATVFVRAEDANKAPLAVLDEASELPYVLVLNTPFAPEFWLEKAADQVVEVDIKTPVSLFAFQALEADALLAWPENAYQPHTKAEFLAAAFDNLEWAYKLYDAYINDDGGVCLNTYLEQVELKDIIFGSESNYQRLARMLNACGCVCVDSGPILTSWDDSQFVGEPDNEVFMFSAVDDDSNEYSTKLTELGIENGYWKGNKFYCEDHEGSDTTIEFFALTPINPFGELACTTE